MANLPFFRSMLRISHLYESEKSRVIRSNSCGVMPASETPNHPTPQSTE
jgi:hypothetical protein